MKPIIFIICILIIPGTFASCSEEQIDINSASIEELIQISYIGQVRAQQLIELRPFSEIEELIEIKGIGGVYLSKIKDQKLACVEELEEEIMEEHTKKIFPKETSRTSEEAEQKSKENFIPSKIDKKYSITGKPIILETKNIKSKENKEILDKSVYAKYGIVLFCLILCTLFIKNKKTNKNEFR